MAVSSDKFGKQIIEALKLPPTTRKVEIIFEADKEIIIKGEFYSEDECIKEFCGVLENKKLEFTSKTSSEDPS